MSSFFSDEELMNVGFKSFGENVLISRNTSIYAPEQMVIGNNVRIDDYCLLSGNITLGDHIHIAAGCYLFGNGGIIMESFSGLSSRVCIYSSSDDYGGEFLTNPTIPDKFRNVISAKVVLKKHAIIGTGSTVLPGVELGEGVAIGAMSLVAKSIEPWIIAVGIPAKKIKERSNLLLSMEKTLDTFWRSV